MSLLGKFSMEVAKRGERGGSAPSSSRGLYRFLLIVMTQMNTDLLVDNLRNLRDNNLCALNDNYPNIRTLYAEKSKKLYKPLGNIKISL